MRVNVLETSDRSHLVMLFTSDDGVEVKVLLPRPNVRVLAKTLTEWSTTLVLPYDPSNGMRP